MCVCMCMYAHIYVCMYIYITFLVIYFFPFETGSHVAQYGLEPYKQAFCQLSDIPRPVSYCWKKQKTKKIWGRVFATLFTSHSVLGTLAWEDANLPTPKLKHFSGGPLRSRREQLKCSRRKFQRKAEARNWSRSHALITARHCPGLYLKYSLWNV